MLDKTKVATLVRSQSALPKMPVKKPMAGPPAAAGKPGMKPPAKPGAKPGASAHPNIDDMTPQEIQTLVEEAAQMAEGQQDHELEDQLVDYMHGDTSQPPAWATDHELWQKALNAVEPNADRYEEPYAVTAYLYKKLGGQLAGAQGQQPPEGAAPHQEPHPDAAGKPPAGAKPPAPGAKPAGAGALAPKPPMGAKPPAGKPPMGAKPPPKPGAVPAQDGAAGGDLKAMLDEAAQQAQTQPDPDIMAKLQAEPPQEGQPPSWAADHDKWSKAEGAVKPHWTEYPDPWVVVAHVYKNMGGGVQ